MPWIHHQPLDRRSFLKTTIASTAAIATLGKGTQAFGQGASTRWAFFSDTHVPGDPTNEYRGFRPYDNYKILVQDVLDAKPEGAVITGDLARLEGFSSDYAMLKALSEPLAEIMPVGMALGNHDDRANFLNAFQQSPGEKQKINGKHTVVLETASVRLILLDSNFRTNLVSGLLGQAQRNWLKAYLAQSGEKPALLFFHHPLTDGDNDLLDGDRLMNIIRPMKQVKAIFFGHSHVYTFAQRDGIHFINLPAVGYNFNDRDPIGWIEAVMTAEGGDFTLHAIGGNLADDGKTTSIRWRT